MQTLDVINAIAWLEKVAGSFMKELEVRLHSERDKNWIPLIYQHADIRALLRNQKDAQEVLTAFNLYPFFAEPDILSTFTSGTNVPEMYQRAIGPWQRMVSCAQPLTSLTVPEALRSESNNEEILTIQIADRPKLEIDVVISTLTQINALYDAFIRIKPNTDIEPLEILKIESGSNVRIDLKGIGEPIKEIKNFIIEMWTKHRHKRIDEIIDHNRAMSSSLKTLHDIDQLAKKKALSEEDANRFRRAIVKNTLGLFENQALIAEIPELEHVDNTKLLASFSPRLLPPPEPLDVTIEDLPTNANGEIVKPRKRTPRTK